jgi:hypothetical protein
MHAKPFDELKRLVKSLVSVELMAVAESARWLVSIVITRAEVEQGLLRKAR